MNNILNKLNLFFEAVPDTVRRYRILVWIIFFALNLVILKGIPFFKIDLTMDAYLQQDDPVKIAFDNFRANFGSDTVIRVIYEAKDGDIFSDDSLRAVSALQDELTNYRDHLNPGTKSELDNISAIKSLINVSYINSHDDSLLSLPFIGKNFPASDTEREELRQRALSHPDYPLLYLSKDSRWGAIIIRTKIGTHIEQDLVVTNNNQVAEFDADTNSLTTNSTSSEDLTFNDLDSDNLLYSGDLDEKETEIDIEDADAFDSIIVKARPKFKPAAAEDHAALWGAIYPYLLKPEYTEHLSFHSVGGPPLMDYRLGAQKSERSRIFLSCLALITLVLCFLFRSLSAVVWPVVIVVLCIAWVFGLVGWSGLLVTEIINLIIFLMIAVGVADAMHILSGYLFFRQKEEDHETALRSVFKKSGLACFLTSITTAVGLLALTLVPIVPLRNFGIFAAIGVFIAFALTVFILPLMLDLWSPYSDKRAARRSGHQHPVQRLLRKVESISYTYPKTIIAIFLVATVIFTFGATKIEVSQSMVKSLLPSSKVRQDFELVDKVMSGTTSAEVMLHANQSDAFKDPLVLNQMEALQTYVETTYPELITVTQSIVNTTKRSYQSLHNNDPSMYKIPQDQRTLEQTLFMFNNANTEDRRQWVSDDYSSARITTTLKTEGTGVYIEVFNDVQLKIDELFDPLKSKYPDFEATLTGTVTLGMAVADYINWSQIRSFGLALVVISILVFLVFGSKRVGFIAMVPNVFPILVAFGTLGYLGFPLNTGTLMIAPIVIGIVVDDSIHFLTHYRAELKHNPDIPTAIRNTIREAGQAITFTSVVLAVGFLVFLSAPDLSLRNFGITSAIAITTALIADIFLLPALCMVFKADFKEEAQGADEDLSSSPATP